MPTLRYKLFEAVLRLSRVNRLIGKAVDGNPSRSAKPSPRLKSRTELLEVEGQKIWIIHPSSGVGKQAYVHFHGGAYVCLLYTSPSPRDKRQSRMPSSA